MSQEKRPSVAQRWRGERLTAEQVRELPPTIELVDVARAWGIGQELAYREVNDSYDPKTRRGMLAGVPLMKLGRRWVGTRAALLESMGLEREGAA